MRIFSIFSVTALLLLNFLLSPANAVTVFEEANGLVAVEAEHYASKTANGTPRAWYLTSTTSTPGVTPDPDGNHASTASGNAYMEGLPDTRTTHDDPLIGGENIFGVAGAGPTLNYKVRFNTPGKYYIRVRAFSSGPEDNGLHVGINGNWPASGNRIQWCKGKGTWTWSGAQRTAEKHCGVENFITLNVPNAGIHTVSFAMREDGFEIDKWVMTNNPSYFPTGKGPAERVDGSSEPPPPLPDGGGSTQNQAPSITSAAKTTAVVGSAYQYDVQASDPDNDTLTFSLPTKPSGMTINSSTGLIKWTPTQQGSNNVVVKVADPGGLVDRQSFTINVSNTAPAPNNYSIKVSSNANRSSAKSLAGANVSGNIYVFVPSLSGITKIQFYLDGQLHRTEKLAPWDFEGGLGNVANPFDSSTLTDGQHTVKAQIQDSTGSHAISNSFQVQNTAPTDPPDTPGNVAPVINSTPVTSVQDGKFYFYDVEAQDANGDKLFYSLQQAPTGMTIEASTGKVKWTPSNQAGSHQVTARVTDPDGLFDQQSYTITVQSSGSGSGSGSSGSSSATYNFDSGVEGFVYADDVFGTAHPLYARGNHTASNGFSGGGLQVSLGGVNSNDIKDGMSGGWTKIFHLDAAATVKIMFKYLLKIGPYDKDECSQVLASIDGEPITIDSNNFIDQLCGNGGSRPPQETGWQEVSVSIPLAQGPHNLTIGGFNNKKTYFEEATDIFIDDVSISSGSAGGSNSILLENARFNYSDDIFGTKNPAYANGSRSTANGLQTTLGGIDKKSITNGMSGGWKQTFTLSERNNVSFTFDYRLFHSGKFESDECSQAFIAVNNNLVPFNQQNYIVKLCGFTGNDPNQDTGWQQNSFSLPLDAGSHSITVGGALSKKTYLNEVTNIYFDNINLHVGQ